MSNSEDSSEIRVERRFLLFQLDFANAALQDGLRPRWTFPAGVPDRPISLSDYSDYDNVRSFIYWRNRLLSNTAGGKNDTWQDQYEKDFFNYAGDVYDQLNNGNLKLRRFGSKKNPFVDLSPYIKSISGYSVALGDFSNSLQISIARPDHIDGDRAGSGGGNGAIFTDLLTLFNGILPRENDILMVLVKYPGQTFVREYMGFVNKVEQGGNYGQVDEYDITVDGISKVLKDSDIIKQAAIKDLYLPNIEINKNENISVLADQNNGKNVATLFEGFMTSVLAMGGHTTNGRYGNVFSDTATFGLNPAPFIPQVTRDATTGKSLLKFQLDGEGGFQFNFFVLMTLFLMTIEQFELGDSLEDNLFTPRNPDELPSADGLYYALVKDLRRSAAGNITDIPDSSAWTILSPLDMAVLDHGDAEAFNLMVASGFELFYPHMSKAADILGEIRTTAFYDVFEARNGKIICRPGRYNKIERTLSEMKRKNIEDPKSEGGIDPSALFIRAKKTTGGFESSSWEFNPLADFYIRKEEMEAVSSRTFDDTNLDSRADVKFSMTMVGSTSFPGGSYTDPDVLIRQGLKTKGPMENPNAQNSEAPKIFAPLALAWTNAQARTASIVVKDMRPFHIGKLYYIEALDCVGFLVGDSIQLAYGGKTTRALNFAMVRTVIRRPLSEMVKADGSGLYNEALNFAMCYMDDPPDLGSLTLDVAAAKVGVSLDVKNMKQLMIEKGLKALAWIISENFDATIVMFRYIPSILDVVMEVEADPALGKRDPEIDNNTKGASKKAQDDRSIAPITNGALDITYDFSLDQNKQYYEDGLIQSVINTFAFESNIKYNVEAIQAQNSTDKKASVAILASQLLAGFIPGGNLAAAALVKYFIFPDAFKDKVIPPFYPAGALNYAPINPQTVTPGWDEAGSNPRRHILYCKSSLTAAALCTKPQNLRLAQILANKLASLDLALKYQAPNSSGLILPQQAGINQLYDCDGKTFGLFLIGKTPAEFFLERAALGYSLIGVIDNIIAMPQCMALSFYKPEEFNNPIDQCYRIKGTGGVYRMPYGHLMIVPTNPALAGKTQFVRVQSKSNPVLGGTFGIIPGKRLNEFEIRPESADSQLIVEDGTGKTYGPGDLLSVTCGTGAIYFITPFAEPTIERLLQLPLPVLQGGQLSKEEVQKIAEEVKSKPGKHPGIVINNNRRPEGDAINVSPEYLAVASKSDLEVYPPRPPQKGSPVGSASVGIWRHFESVFKYGKGNLATFKNAEGAKFFPNALKLQVSYPGGLAGPIRDAGVYQLSIPGTERAYYASSLIPAGQPEAVAATTTPEIRNPIADGLGVPVDA